MVLHRNRPRLSGEVVTKWWTCPHGVCPYGDCWTAWDCRKHDEQVVGDLSLSGYASNLLIASGRLEQLRMLAQIDRLLAALRGT